MNFSNVTKNSFWLSHVKESPKSRTDFPRIPCDELTIKALGMIFLCHISSTLLVICFSKSFFVWNCISVVFQQLTFLEDDVNDVVFIFFYMLETIICKERASSYSWNVSWDETTIRRCQTTWKVQTTPYFLSISN